MPDRHASLTSSRLRFGSCYGLCYGIARMDEDSEEYYFILPTTIARSSCYVYLV